MCEYASVCVKRAIAAVGCPTRNVCLHGGNAAEQGGGIGRLGCNHSIYTWFTAGGITVSGWSRSSVRCSTVKFETPAAATLHSARVRHVVALNIENTVHWIARNNVQCATMSDQPPFKSTQLAKTCIKGSAFPHSHSRTNCPGLPTAAYVLHGPPRFDPERLVPFVVMLEPLRARPMN